MKRNKAGQALGSQGAPTTLSVKEVMSPVAAILGGEAGLVADPKEWKRNALKKSGLQNQQAGVTQRFTREPMFSMLLTMVSPTLRYRRGSRTAPTPLGVPEKITSPGCSRQMPDR
jgi:hypothetical protein